jgi:hypothetical protein
MVQGCVCVKAAEAGALLTVGTAEHTPTIGVFLDSSARLIVRE